MNIQKSSSGRETDLRMLRMSPTSDLDSIGDLVGMESLFPYKAGAIKGFQVNCTH